MQTEVEITKKTEEAECNVLHYEKLMQEYHTELASETTEAGIVRMMELWQEARQNRNNWRQSYNVLKRILEK